MTPLSPGFVRVTLSSPELEHFTDVGLDQRVKLVLPLADSGLAHFPIDGDDDDWSWWQAWRELPAERQNPIRTYTARSIRPLDGEIDIDFVCHGDTGPASAWARRAGVGDEVVVVGPDARSSVAPMGIEWNPGHATTLLLVGDETAVPAISAICQSLDQDARGRVILEVPSPSDILPIAAPSGVDVTWLPRATPAADCLRPGDALVPAVRDWTSRYLTARHHGRPADAETLRDIDVDHEILWEVPGSAATSGDLYAFLAGEAGAITTLRRFLVSEMGIDRRHVAFMGYWRAGRAEN